MAQTRICRSGQGKSLRSVRNASVFYRKSILMLLAVFLPLLVILCVP